jgi:hypothetical protein
MALTKQILQRLSDEDLDLSASITLKLFEEATSSKAKNLLKQDLKLFLAEFEARG